MPYLVAIVEGEYKGRKGDVIGYAIDTWEDGVSHYVLIDLIDKPGLVATELKNVKRTH